MALHVNGPVRVEEGLDGKSIHLVFEGADTVQHIVFRSSDHYESQQEDIDRQYALLMAARPTRSWPEVA